jgi:hypothetical protein
MVAFLPIRRRRLAQSIVLAGLSSLPISIRDVFASQREKPIWVGFGLNGSALDNRFEITREFVKREKNKDLSSREAFSWFRDSLDNSVKTNNSGELRFRNEAQLGVDQLLGFVHDYEAYSIFRDVSTGTKEETVYLIAAKMVGAGLVCTYEKSIGWRLLASFPFVMEWELQKRGSRPNLRSTDVKLVENIYRNYGEAFSKHTKASGNLSRTSSANYFARVVKARVHPDAEAKLQKLNLQKSLTSQFIGFTSSSEICRHLGMPLLPYLENDALANRYAVRFTEDLIAQNTIVIPDADLQFEVVVRDVEKELRPRMQFGVTEIHRLLVVDFRVYEADFSTNQPKRILRTIAYADADIDKIPYEQSDYDTPDRDFVFFDRLFVRTLTFLLQGLAKNDPKMLAKSNVKHADVVSVIPRINHLVQKTR